MALLLGVHLVDEIGEVLVDPPALDLEHPGERRGVLIAEVALLLVRCEFSLFERGGVGETHGGIPVHERVLRGFSIDPVCVVYASGNWRGAT